MLGVQVSSAGNAEMTGAVEAETSGCATAPLPSSGARGCLQGFFSGLSGLCFFPFGFGVVW